MTLYKFMTQYAEKSIDYTIEDLEILKVNTDTFLKDYQNYDTLRTLDTWGRIADVVEDEEECIVYMQNHIYF